MGIGFASAVSLLVIVARGSIALIEFAYLLLGVFTLWWVLTVPVGRLSTHMGRPRPVLFGVLSGLSFVAAVSLTTFPEPLVAGAGVCMTVATMAGLGRVLRQR